MKITNLHHLPEVFRNFEKNHPYDKGPADLSVTTLIDSPQIARLSQQHNDVITEDISNRIFAILGTAVHAILEDGVPENCVAEQRLYATFGDKILSGQIDLQTPHPDGGMILSDYKTASAVKLQFNPNGTTDWKNQLNVYAGIARANGIEVKGLEVIVIIRDWTLRNAERNENYPQLSVVSVGIDMWEPDKTIEYIHERLAHHANMNSECSDEERWKRDGKVRAFEYTRSGELRKRATKVFSTRTEAEIFHLNSEKPVVLVDEPSTYIRCENYCSVSKFCPQLHKENA